MRSIGGFGLAALLLASAPAYGENPGWRVSEVSGSVSVGRSGRTLVASRGGKLQPGDLVNTGPGGRAVLLRGQEYVVLSQNSRIEIAEPRQSNGLMQVIEHIGSVLFRIDKKETPHFGVKTPYLAAVVKGTTFTVNVSGPKAPRYR